MSDSAPEPLDLPDDDELVSIADLVSSQIAAEAEVARLELDLKRAKEHLATIRCDLLPNALSALGLQEIVLDTGDRVTVRENYVCGQLDDGPSKDTGRSLEERLKALRWLEQAGHGDIARRVITVTLGAKSEHLERQLLTLLAQQPQANHYTIDHRKTVPWNTLAAFAREQVRLQQDPPLDVLGVSVQRMSKITRKQETT